MNFDFLNYLDSHKSLADIASFLKAKRIQQHLTQEELAAKAGVSIQTIKSIEGGKDMKLSTFIALMKVFDCWASFGELLDSAQVQFQGTQLEQLKADTKSARQRVRHPKSAT